MRKKLIRSATGALAIAALAVTACERSSVEPPGHEELGTVAIMDRSAIPQVVLATWTFGSGWDRDLLATVSHADEQDRTRIVLGVRMWTRGGEELTLVEDGEYEARYGVESDPDNVVNLDPAFEIFHGDHVYVYGFNEEERTGTAELVFVLWHDGHADGQTDPIALTFTE